MSLFSIGLSGLFASQRALGTAGHNIANANTEGFSRQRVDLAIRQPQFEGGYYLGKGVTVAGVQRVYDSFLVSQLRVSTSNVGSVVAYHDLATSVDNVLADPAAGLMPVLQNFFDAVQDTANDPTSGAARQVMLSEGQALAERFHTLDTRITELVEGQRELLRNATNEVNSLVDALADVNSDIRETGGTNFINAANDLLDMRDNLLRQISEKVNITALENADGTVNVTVGNGQNLVVGASVSHLAIMNNSYDPTVPEVGFTSGGTTVEISNMLNGGEIGGLLALRDELLIPAQNALGKVAIGIADTFNAQHHLGVDLNGNAGADFFTNISSGTNVSPVVRSSTANTGTAVLAAEIIDVSQMTDSDYRLDFDGADYTVTRMSDSQVVYGPGALPATVDGVRITVSSGTPAANDSFLLQPTRFGARDFDVRLRSTAEIAAAAPVRASDGFNNIGSATISAGAVNSPYNRATITFSSPTTYDVVDQDTGATLAANQTYSSGSNISYNGWTVAITNGGGAPAAGDLFTVDNSATSTTSTTATIGPATISEPDPNLTDTVTITFNNPPTTFNVAGSTTGAPATNVTYTNGGPISFNGWTVDISGTPAAGDTFTVTQNLSGVGDNRNALLLAGLQNDLTMGNGRSSYGDAYTQLVADVGSKTRQAEINRNAQEVLLEQARESRDMTSGVSLDEEAANLLKFQQAYQANAKVISIADSMFQALLSAVGR